MSVVWVDAPPARNTNRGANAEEVALVAVLAENIGQWAVIKERAKTAGLATAINSGKRAAFRDSGREFEAVARKRGDGKGYDIYARAI